MNNHTEHELPRTLVKLNKLDAELVKSTQNDEERVYKCPLCVEKRKLYGKKPTPDLLGKLYINVEKEMGLCFRCNTIVIIGYSINNAIEKLAKTFESMINQIDPYGLPDINIESYKSAVEVPEAMEYLRKRNPFISSSLIKLLDMRWYQKIKKFTDDKTGKIKIINRRGILTPIKFKINGELRIKSFQIRFLTEDKKFRFYTLDGVKSIYCLSSISEGSKITLVEGIFDAIAADLLGYPFPVAILGKSISKFQISQLRELVPSEINLALDTKQCNLSVYKTVRNQIPSCGRIKKIDLKGLDPEEFYLKQKSQKGEYNGSWRSSRTNGYSSTSHNDTNLSCSISS